jgi:pyridoxine 4-dehydrogenase
MTSSDPRTESTSSGTPRPGGVALLGDRTVSRVGFGAMQLERLHADRPAGLALLRRAADLGVDHFDTAQFYGDGLANELLAAAFGASGDVTIVTKVGADPDRDGPIALRPAQKPAELRASVEANLRSLGRDRLDVVNLRRLDVGPGITATGDQAVDVDDQLAEMIALREEGKIGAIGLSSITLEVLTQALPAGIVCVQNAYSLVSREFESMLELCTAEGIAWVPFFPLGSAFASVPSVTDRPAVREVAAALGVTPSQVGLAWLLQHSPEVLLIPGTADMGHLEQNVAAGDVVLDAAAVAALES